MFRLIFLTFHGKQRYDEHHVHVHESPWTMLGPLVMLAILSVMAAGSLRPPSGAAKIISPRSSHQSLAERTRRRSRALGSRRA